MRGVSPYFKRVFRTYDQLNSVVEEDVKGIRVVKSCNRENYEIQKFDGISKSIYEDFSKGERLLALNSPLMQLCMYGCMILVSWIGAKAIVASGNNAALGLTTGQLTALLSYAQQILMSLMMLSMVLTMITMSASSGSRIAEILNEKPDITNPEHPVMTVKDWLGHV
jgi:ATP-binding cassette subfamily B multidrug efflux pump